MRTAISRLRDVARASNRFAMFAQAIKSTSAHRSQQHQQRRPDVLHQLILHAIHVDPDPGVVDGVGLLQPLRDGVHLGSRFFDADAVLQTPHGDDAGMPGTIVRQSAGPRSNGNQNVRRLNQLKLRRQNASNRVGLVVERYVFAECAGRAREMCLPESVADESHRRAARAILVRAKSMSLDSSYAQQRKQRGRCHLTLHAFRLAAARQSKRRDASRREVVK